MTTVTVPGLGLAAFFFAFCGKAMQSAVGSNIGKGRLRDEVDGKRLASVFASTSLGFFTLAQILSALGLKSFS